MKKNLNIMKPHYSKQIWPVLWPIIISRFHCTLEPWYNKPLHSKVRGITNALLGALILTFMKKNLHAMEPCYSGQIFPVPWPFVILRFHGKWLPSPNYGEKCEK